MNYRKSFEVIGYTYEADVHCIKCTLKRFPQLENDLDEYEGIDEEENEIHPIFLDDEFEGSQVCGDCFEPVE